MWISWWCDYTLITVQHKHIYSEMGISCSFAKLLVLLVCLTPPPPTHFPVSSPTQPPSEGTAFNTAASRCIAQALWISPFPDDHKTHHSKRCSNYLWLAIIRPPLEQLHPRTKSLQTKTQSAIKMVNVKERKGGLWNYAFIPADWSNWQQQHMMHAGQEINRTGPAAWPFTVAGS